MADFPCWNMGYSSQKRAWKSMNSANWVYASIYHGIPAGKQTKPLKITTFDRYINYSWVIFHSYVKLPEGIYTWMGLTNSGVACGLLWAASSCWAGTGDLQHKFSIDFLNWWISPWESMLHITLSKARFGWFTSPKNPSGNGIHHPLSWMFFH